MSGAARDFQPVGLDESDSLPPGEAATPTEEQIEQDWLNLARDAYHSSASFTDTSLRARYEKALALFQNRHPAGSKYNTEAYLKRSRHFRPKIRSAIRRIEAAAAVSLFSTGDMLSCEAFNANDKEATLGAKIKQELVNYRLQQPEQRWFITAIGGFQEAATMGVVVSRQEWLYEERVQRFKASEQDLLAGLGGEDGTIEERKVVADRPSCRLIPRENIRFDPACDWRDPVRTSPYIIELMPMYVGDVLDRMAKDPEDRKAQFRQVDEGIVRAAAREDWDSIRRAREQGRLDRYTANRGQNEFDIVWVHRYIVRIHGQDIVYYTLGTEILLSDPKPLEEEVWHGERDYAVGYAIIEAHKSDPDGVPLLAEGTVELANDIVNLRLDNVKLALNNRYFIRRGSGVDTRALMRNVPGGGVLMSDINKDVKVDRPQDVTSSSYQEQNYNNADMDDLVGTFSGSSVNTNRELNETVGGMNILSANASELTEYMIRTVSETWLEEVMRQYVLLEECYESDQMVLEAASVRAGADMATAMKAMRHPTQVRVNIGFGSTNPLKRIERLTLGLRTVASVFPEMMMEADRGEVVGEVFGALGYKDGVRFFPKLAGEDDPRIQQLQAQLQQLQQFIDSGQMEIEGKKAVAEINANASMMREHIKGAFLLKKTQLEGELEVRLTELKRAQVLLDAQIRAEANETKRKELWLQREALSFEIQDTERRWQREVAMSAAALTAPNVGKHDDGSQGDFKMPVRSGDMVGTTVRGRYAAIPGAKG